jgi:hypothetical protein
VSELVERKRERERERDAKSGRNVEQICYAGWITLRYDSGEEAEIG